MHRERGASVRVRPWRLDLEMCRATAEHCGVCSSIDTATATGLLSLKNAPTPTARPNRLRAWDPTFPY